MLRPLGTHPGGFGSHLGAFGGIWEYLGVSGRFLKEIRLQKQGPMKPAASSQQPELGGAVCKGNSKGGWGLFPSPAGSRVSGVVGCWLLAVR